jgi:quercetin dioxygenase-like cupin family protein
MKRENTWTKGGLNAKILMNKPNKQIVLTALHKGTEINSFQSNDSITIQVIEGELKFHTQNESITLEKGQMLTLQENIDYSLTTKAETVLLFTIAKQILQPATM